MFRLKFPFLSSFTQSLVWGYIVVLVFLLASIVIFSIFNAQIQQKLYQTERLYQKKQLIEEHIQLAQERSITLMKMFETDDPFVVDELQQHMQQLERKIGQVRRKTKALLQDNPHYLALFDQTTKLIKKNKQQQTKVYQLLFEENKPEAIKVLIHQTVPAQENIIQTLSQLKENHAKLYERTKEQAHSLIKILDILTLFAGLIPIGILIIIAFLTLRKIDAHEQQQQHFQEALETALQQRTQELQLDHALFEHIHEAIALAEPNGTLIKQNQPFQNLIDHLNLTHTNQSSLSLWQTLALLFKNFNINQVQSCLEKKESWQREVRLSSTTQYYLLTISRLNLDTEHSSLLSIVLNDISHLKQAQQKLKKIAITDAVTQLKNRFALNEQLKLQLASPKPQPFTIIMIDLDHFKAINDQLGHDEGDRLLRSVANILHQTTEQQAIIADIYRIGGDEFIIWVHQNMTEQKISKLYHHILKQFNQIPNKWKKLSLGCSMGVARYPYDTQNPEELLRFADIAMYHAKKQGRNQFQIFSQSLRQNIDYMAQMQTQMQQAIQQKAFKVYFQPQFNLNDLSLCGAEALLRWPTEDGMISPGEFIPLAEKLDLINALGHFVLTTSVNIFCKWQTQNKTLPRIAINISAEQVKTQTLIPDLESTLKHHNIQPEQLDFEITETILMNNKTNNQSLAYLERLGCEISIDDFGTGYSSLAYIQNLNANRIKIDRSFITPLAKNNASYNIVKAVIEMGHSLGLKVLAEGIETQEQLTLLQELGCDEGQGFLFDAPLSEQDFFNKYIQS